MSAIQEQSFCNTHLMGHCFQKMFSPYFRVAGFPTVLFSILWNNALLFSFFPFLPLSPAFPFLFHCIIVATLRGSLSSGQQLRRFRKSPDYYDFNFPLYVYPSRGSTVLSLQLGFFYDVTFSCVHWVEILVRDIISCVLKVRVDVDVIKQHNQIPNNQRLCITSFHNKITFWENHALWWKHPFFTAYMVLSCRGRRIKYVLQRSLQRHI